MRSRIATVLAGLALFASATAYADDPPTYGRVETFEPGKKYSCTPTADHKAWDCNEAGKANVPAKPEPAAPVAAPAPAIEQPASTIAAEPTPAPVAAPTPTPAPTPAPAPMAAPSKPARTSELPGYLTNAAASGATPPRSRAAAAPRATPAAPDPVVTPKAVTSNTETTAAAAPAPAKAEKPRVVSAPVPAPPIRPAPESGPMAARGGFLDVSPDRFVIEIAHAASAEGLAATRAALHLSRGEVYELHLRQNGADNWLLVWGSFDSIDAARSARAELSAQAGVTPGWPRRVAPLQAEVRHTQ